MRTSTQISQWQQQERPASDPRGSSTQTWPIHTLNTLVGPVTHEDSPLLKLKETTSKKA